MDRQIREAEWECGPAILHCDRHATKLHGMWVSLSGMWSHESQNTGSILKKTV